MRSLTVAGAVAVLLTAVGCTSTPPPAARAPTPATPSVARSIRATLRVVVRPVTSAGRPTSGYRVVTETFDDGFLCDGGPSPVAVDPDIRYCGFSATNTVACWDSAVPATVLCLRNPLTHTLVRIRYTGRFAPTHARSQPVPQAVVLRNGTRCLIRDGGAWASVAAHPSWIGFYYCPRGPDLYGPIAGNGIDQTTPTWIVHTAVVRLGKPATVRTQTVQVAYYVGSA